MKTASTDARLQSRTPTPVKAYLELARVGAQPPRLVPLEDEVVIGRQLHAGGGLMSGDAPAEAFIGLAEHTVSRRHARIRLQGTTYCIEDLCSVNGTTVDGERLLPGEIHPLCDGDEVGIAGAALVFHSMLMPAPERMPSVITGSIDATQYARADRVPGSLAQPGESAPSASSLESAVQKLHAMAQVGIALGAVTDRATMIEKVMKFIFDLFPQAERAFILLLPGESGKIEQASRAGQAGQAGHSGNAAHAGNAGNAGSAGNAGNAGQAGQAGQPGHVGHATQAPQALPLVPDAARRRDGQPIDPGAIRMSRTIVRQVLEQHQSILSVDTLADRHFGRQESILAQPIRSVMCVPLLLEHECLGLIQVDTASDPQAFTAADLEMLTGVCAEAAVALKNFQLYSDIEQLLDGFVRASVQAIEERDPVTAGHSFRVADYAERLAMVVDRAQCRSLRHLSFSRDQVREIRYAALLHDFGKVGVREHVLRKEKKLHHAEMRLLEQRFLTARVGLEAQAYRRLVERHLDDCLDHAQFSAATLQAQALLGEEFTRLDGFLDAIRQANEPAIQHAHCGRALDDVRAYSYPAGDGQALPLLEPFEFSALSLVRGCLTPDERRQIESHVADSHAFLVLIPWTRDLAKVPAIAHGHHEKLDGSGYPQGLRGAQISIETRILTICDIFDALTAADRPYKKAVPVEQALALMREECDAGHLDPVLFDAFTESRVWLAEGWTA